MNYPFRSGSVLYLRALETDDMEHCLRWFNDPLITRFLEQGTFPVSRAQQKEFLVNVAEDDSQIVLAICRDDNDLHVGNIGLNRISYINRHAELAVVIGERTLHRKGYGSAASQLMLKYGFETLNLERIYLRVSTMNKPASNCYKKLGFTQEGLLRQHVYKDGAYHDEIFMGLLRSEWANQ